MRSAAWLSADTTFAPIRGPAAVPNSDPPRMRPENLLLLALLAAACAPPAPTGAMQFPPPEVTVTTVVLQDIPIALDYLGKTEASREVEVRARVQGYLATRDFVEGAVVKAGDLLYTIDPKPLQAQAQVAKAEVAIAQARLEQAVREVARLAPLVGTEAVTKKDIDDAKSAEQIASASLQQAQAHLDQITLELGYTRVTAPFAGVTGRAVRYEGSLVEPGTNSLLTTLLQLDPIHVMFQRTENQQIALDRDLASGRIALPADGKLTVELQHRDGTVLASGGAINFVDGKLEALTGTIPLRATLANPALRLRAGQAVKVVLRGAVLKNAIAIPQRAVVESPQGKVAMVAIDKAGATVFEPRPIEVGEWIDLPGTGPAARGWIVRTGLAAGDRVILDNLVKLGRMPPGLPVVIVPATAPTPADSKKGN